eukprot:9262246-Karenia_brevis.AAC.1
MAPLMLMTVTAQQLDLIVCDFFDQMYFMGKTYGDGTKLLAAIKHVRPEFGRHGHVSLARASHALTGWQKQSPGNTRNPLPILGLYAIMGYLVTMEMPLAACALLRGFDA